MKRTGRDTRELGELSQWKPTVRRKKERETREQGSMRCRSCGRVMKSSDSQRDGICAICKRDGPRETPFIPQNETRSIYRR
jgi:hypothetical protein